LKSEPDVQINYLKGNIIVSSWSSRYSTFAKLKKIKY